MLRGGHQVAFSRVTWLVAGTLLWFALLPILSFSGLSAGRMEAGFIVIVLLIQSMIYLGLRLCVAPGLALNSEFSLARSLFVSLAACVNMGACAALILWTLWRLDLVLAEHSFWLLAPVVRLASRLAAGACMGWLLGLVDAWLLARLSGNGSAQMRNPQASRSLTRTLAGHMTILVSLGYVASLAASQGIGLGLPELFLTGGSVLFLLGSMPAAGLLPSPQWQPPRLSVRIKGFAALLIACVATALLYRSDVDCCHRTRGPVITHVPASGPHYDL